MFSLGLHGCTCMCTKWSLFCMKMYSIHVWMVLVALVFCVSASFFNLPFFKKWGKNKFRNNLLSSIHSSSIFCMNDANSSLEMSFCLMMKNSGKLFLFLCNHTSYIYVHMYDQKCYNRVFRGEIKCSISDKISSRLNIVNIVNMVLNLYLSHY